jgi:hypothetical protein
MRFTVAIAIYVHTPSTILPFSGLFDADDSCESAHDDKQKPHMRLLNSLALLNPSPYTLFPVSCDETRRIATNIAERPIY